VRFFGRVGFEGFNPLHPSKMNKESYTKNDQIAGVEVPNNQVPSPHIPQNATGYYSMGIDAHKRFCQVHVLDPYGQAVWKGRLNEDEYGQFENIVKQLDGPCRAVFECSMNWHVLYDQLCGIEGMEEVQMANPLKCRIICDAQLKNDKVDAQKLAMLLRLGMVPRAHATGAEARRIKEVVRQRAAWVGMRTRIRNRTHRLLGGAQPKPERLPAR